MTNEQGIWYSDQPGEKGSGYHAQASAHPDDHEQSEFNRQSTMRWDLLSSLKILIKEIFHKKSPTK
jgi:hypothetical protein